MSFTAAEIAVHLNGEVVGDAQVTLLGFAPADTARAGDLTFAETEQYLARAEQSAASAIITDAKTVSSAKVLIRVKNARVGFARAVELFFPEPVFVPGVHPTAVIAASAQVDATAHVGPHCAIGERTVVGARAVLQGGNHVGADCRIGEETKLFPNVTLYAGTELGRRVRIHSGTVVGADGFGYVMDGGRHRKIPQIGNVIIGDDVEIGSNVSIDRGALGPTIIGKGTKIDNLVQIAHNVRIGEHSIIVGHVAIAGSARIGNYTVIAGKTAIAGHISIGNQVTIGGMSGVMHDVPDGEKWWGVPAAPAMQIKRQQLALKQLPELIKRVRDLEKRLAETNPRVENGPAA